MAKKKTQNLSRSFGFNSPDYSTGGNLYFLGGNAEKKATQGINVSGLVDMAIPGAGAAMSVVNQVGDSAGGGLGAAIKGSINPFNATFNKNLKPWQRALGTINPALGGLMSYNEQQKEDSFNSGVADMRQRNEMLDIKANGGSLRSYEVSDVKPFTSWYDSQPFYTKALQNKYKDLPTKEIIANATNDKTFRNRKLNQYNDSLISKYGDKYLTANEVDSVAKLNNIPNIFDLDKQVKLSDYNGAGEMNNTIGSKENTLNKYGYRMMLNRSFPKGQSPYKAMGGFITASGVPSNMATEYAQGGNIKKSFNPNLAKNDVGFNKWYSKNTLEGQGKIPYSNDQVYDYYSFYKNNEHLNPEYSIDQHFPDTYKRPSHPTFSNESIYSTPEKPGGSWNGENYNKNGKFLYADGGFLNEFNTGGSHESNPQNGIPQGIAEDGQPNKVEEGETKYQDYIFSDRLKIDKQAVEEHNMPKSMIKKTFADASKKIAKLHKERPNDPITRDTMRSQMNHLMMANDEIREYEQSSMMAKGGYLYAGGAPLLIGNKLVDVNKPQNNEMLASRIGNSFINPSSGLLPMPSQIQKLETGKLQSKINSTGDLDGKTDLGFFRDPKNLRYAPIAFDALAASGLFGKSPNPEVYSPAIIRQQGLLTAPRINEESMRAKIDAAYQNQIRGMAGASGGSGAALRSGLTGIGDDYMSAVGQGFLGAETANNQAKMQADQYNLGTSQNIASQNAQMQNQAGLYNNQMINQNNALNYDNKMSYLGKGAEGLGDIGYEARNAEIMPRIFRYTDLAKYAPNAKACGGRLKMLKRKK